MRLEKTYRLTEKKSIFVCYCESYEIQRFTEHFTVCIQKEQFTGSESRRRRRLHGHPYPNYKLHSDASGTLGTLATLATLGSLITLGILGFLGTLESMGTLGTLVSLITLVTLVTLVTLIALVTVIARPGHIFYPGHSGHPRAPWLLWAP